MKPNLLPAIILLLIFASAEVNGQNMVPNGDFESYNTCPAALSGIAFSPNYTSFPTATSWVNPLKNSTPDYLNSCAASSTGVKVPSSIFGYQPAFDGSAYAGIIAWDGQYSAGVPVFDYREYVQNQLTQPMLTGHTYCVSFYVNPTISPGFSFNYVGIDQIGVNFSDTAAINTTDYVMSLPLDISNPPGNFLTDTAKWYKVQGVYTAAGGERWITAGCFKNGTGTPTFQQLYPPIADPNLSYRCYLYLDGFSIKEITAADTQKIVHDTIVCKPTGLAISLSGVSAATGYQWSNGAHTNSILAIDTGTYWCKSAVECGMIIDSFHIRFLPIPKLDLGTDTSNCLSQPVSLASNHTYATYLWSTGAITPAITVTTSGTYTLTVSSYCGLQIDTIQVNIQAPTLPPLVSDTMICQFVQEPLLNVQGTDIKWYPDLTTVYGMAVQPFINTAQYGEYIWYVSQTKGSCESPRVPVHVEIRYMPAADIGDYYALCVNTDTVLLGHVYPDVTYRWNTSESACCIVPHETGTYQLTITNECGTSSDTAFVEISPCDDCLSIPNAFTPNNDSRNDRFMPLPKCPVTNYRMRIFNRWGQQVFTTDDLGTGWNGRFEGRMAEEGAYVYLMEFRSVTTGVLNKLKGNVTLIR